MINKKVDYIINTFYLNLTDNIRLGTQENMSFPEDRFQGKGLKGN